ncbi:hypothetical protein B0920_20720 [Massilia sp. KIM]|uniref:hypothetical protein n=1 Tax=Massilia sp. KIM TaxID=1955422 RepID=UPI00098F00CF|nr:hypothetical protein [Massilia sp. KIM]OON59710.1 hypothetical protein B0920_20720 [Massilia sp. KIM]
MKHEKILIAALLACAFAPALAEEAGEAEERAERRIVTRLGDSRDELVIANGLPMGGAIIQQSLGRAVKNAPYSALSVSERIQHLADGNQIVNKTVAMNYRDSAGRTRTEVRDDDGEVRVITINDPVEGVRYVLRPETKTATKVGNPGEIARAAAEQARAAAEKARASAEQGRVAGDQARLAAEQARQRIEQLRREGRLPEGGRFIVKEVERGGEHKDVQIRVAQPMPGAPFARPEFTTHIGPMIAGAFGDAKWSAKAVSKELGTREFSGVKAQGRQRSYEIPAGEIGNRNPITVSSETWSSPELRVVVYDKRSDPRSGETVYRLEDLKREEPAAALFTVPSDYTVRDVMTPPRTALKKTD